LKDKANHPTASKEARIDYLKLEGVKVEAPPNRRKFNFSP